MKTFIISFVSILVPFVVIDGVWLTVMTPRFYTTHLSHLLTESPKLTPAAIFYLLYIIGITVLVVLPALRHGYSLWEVALYGAILGCVAYAAYDLTNQATLHNWPVIVTIIDLIWGTTLTASVSVLGTYITRLFI